MSEERGPDSNRHNQDNQLKEWQKSPQEIHTTPDPLQQQLQKSEDMNLGTETQKLDDLKRKNSDQE